MVNLRRSELLGHDRVAKKNVYEKLVPPGISGNRRPLSRQPSAREDARGTTAFQRTQAPGVAAHAVQRENLMQAARPSASFLRTRFPRWPGRAAFRANTHQSASTKVWMLAINRNPLQTVIGQNEPTQDFLGIANVL